MADENSSKPVPEHWKLVVEKRRNGSEISVYKCPETGQKFYTYEDLMRYVNYAKSATLGIYSPYFGRQCSNLNKKAGSSYVDWSSKDSDTVLPRMARLELMPADEKASMDKHSESGEARCEETPCPSEASSTKDNRKKEEKKKKKKHK